MCSFHRFPHLTLLIFSEILNPNLIYEELILSLYFWKNIHRYATLFYCETVALSHITVIHNAFYERISLNICQFWLMDFYLDAGFQLFPCWRIRTSISKMLFLCCLTFNSQSYFHDWRIFFKIYIHYLISVFKDQLIWDQNILFKFYIKERGEGENLLWKRAVANTNKILLPYRQLK